MEHVEVLRDLSEVCRAAIKAGDWKVDGACDPDSLLRHADAAIASLSAPQPPAEAQAQGGGEVVAEVVLHNNLLYGRLSRDLPVGTKLYTAPPSAPVGVDGFPPDVQEIIRRDEAAWALAERAEAAGAERDSDDNETWWTLRIEQFYALSQQPAADTHNRRLKAQLEQEWANLQDLKRAYQTQQPAAVDGAMVERALAAYLRRQEDGESLYGCVTAALTAALAGQQGGSDNDR